MVTPFNSAYTYPQHRISVTDNLRAGNAISAAGQLNGVPVALKQFEGLGNPTPVVASMLITAGVAGMTAGVANPMTAASANGVVITGGVATLDFPRNVTVTSDGTDTTTLLVQGADYYGAAMSELITLSGSGSTIDAGLKAFYTVNSVTATATTNGNIGVSLGKVLGLSFALLPGSLLVGTKNISGTTSADAGTVVAADTTSPATSTTGDVRGTYSPAGTLVRATTNFYAEYQTLGGPSNVNAFGVTQA